MKKMPIPHVDSGAICALVFYVNRSNSYYEAKKYASWFKNNSMIKVGGRNVHVVTVLKETGEAILATGLIDIIKEWRGTRIYGPDGTILNAWQLSNILSCYAMSIHARDLEAYCCYTERNIQFPCRQAAFRCWNIERVGSLREQYLAEATKFYAILCPGFTRGEVQDLADSS